MQISCGLFIPQLTYILPDTCAAEGVFPGWVQDGSQCLQSDLLGNRIAYMSGDLIFALGNLAALAIFVRTDAPCPARAT